MRYTVGNKYIFGHINFIEKNPGLYKLYKPWEDELIGVDLFVMECVEYHKVPNASDESMKPTCHGYVFKLISSNTTYHLNGKDRPLPEMNSLWNNQYPMASYGQLSTANDWVLTPQSNEPEMDSYHMGSGRLVDIREMMDNVYRGITLPEFQTEEMKQKKEALEQWFTDLQNLLKTNYNVDTLLGPSVRLGKDMGHLKVVLVRPREGLLSDPAGAAIRFQRELEQSYDAETTSLMRDGNGGKGWHDKRSR